MRRKQLLGFLLMTAILLATPGLVIAGPAPDNDAPGIDAGQSASEQQPPSGRFYVQIDINSGEDAASLAQLLPEWDEAFEAGSSKVILTDDEIARVRNRGYVVTVLGDAPAIPDTWPSCYSHLTELNTWLQTFAADNPTLVELIDYGDSWCKTQGGCTTPAPQNWS
ncbi:MAG: hypothetical protein KDH89_09625, partial [Anaerolineae bacterium]|nr:hypothetical protein [Anaerolineae bacterium]